eukprot:COSAG01_NODE_1964_length_8779_cov_447.550922_9_plen_101_part_00
MCPGRALSIMARVNNGASRIARPTAGPTGCGSQAAARQQPGSSQAPANASAAAPPTQTQTATQTLVRIDFRASQEADCLPGGSCLPAIACCRGFKVAAPQ